MKKIILLLICLLLTGCTKYEDTNGIENTNLQTITDQNIIHLETGASGLGHSETEIFGITSSEYSSKNFNGVEQLYLTNYILDSDVEIYVSYINVKSGNFKFAIILNDKIIKEIPADTFNETFRFEDIKGTFSIHVAGESANVEFNFYVQ